jgi:hypothetical protein
MSDKIDVNAIMKELEEKLRKGLSDKKLDATGISQLIGEHLEKAKEKVLQDASELINEEVKPCKNEKCKDCGGGLKKTKKETSH